MQHDIGEHALLADSRTAALVDPDGDIVWMCWPRVDSEPLLYSLIDEGATTFSVRPVQRGARVLHRGYHEGTLVLRTTWAAGSARLHVDDALRCDAGPQLLRLLTADGDVDVEVRARFAAGDLPALHVLGERSVEGDTMVSRISLRAGERCLVSLGGDTSTSAESLDATLSRWRAATAAVADARLDDTPVGLLGEATCRAALRTAACVLLGLLQRGGGIVAAPTTSLPQWPGGSRNWDYRYSWMRDASLAGLALLRLELDDAAWSLAEFIGAATSERPPSLLRVDGMRAPAEQVRAEYGGYRGARPVRVGNDAARQWQLDVAGEVLQLATALRRSGDLPLTLRRAVPLLAEASMRTWKQPDHGIWEIRGAPRHYTHSRVMAWSALHDAAQLAADGVVEGDHHAWESAAQEIRAATLRAGNGPLQLEDHGGGADAALSVAPLCGFLEPTDARSLATLHHIRRRLGRTGLLERHEAAADTSAEPCAPFVFPSFWMASALSRCGQNPSESLQAAMAASGELGLFGEVADPESHGPLGNYPQVQSHASCVLALTRAPEIPHPATANFRR